MEFLVGGVAAIGATIFTNPMEVVKTRFQLQGELQARGLYTVHYKNFFHAFYAIAKADGIMALQKGLVPAMWYQLFLNGVRLGIYQFVEDRKWTHNKDGSLSPPKTVLAGAIAGCTGTWTGSPFFLLKTHLQAQAAKEVAVGHQHGHTSMTKGLVTIYKKHGIRGLYRGAWGSLPRAAVGSGTQIGTFHSSKDYLARNYEVCREYHIFNSFVASMISGFIVSVFVTPFDVCMTRLYNQGVDAKGKGLTYTGVLDCFVKIGQKEGVLGYFKGFVPSYARLGPHTVLCFVFWDELKKLHHEYFDIKTISNKVEK